MSRISAVVLGFTMIGSLAAAPPDAKKFGWETEYAVAKAKAARAGKPLLVVFRCVP